ncbi:MAG: hypothetical protein PWQ70_1957 [Clostridiales bacterium]|jgi:sporulation integral membrane protein YtvI|nr:hypothetical protein [Clostridiales bacterium]
MSILPKKHMNFLLTVAALVLGIALGYFVLTTVLKWFLPFILAYVIAHISEPVVVFMEKKLKIPRPIASAIAILSVLLLISAIITFIVYRMIYEIKRLAERLPEFFDMITLQVNELLDKGIKIYLNLPDEISQFVDSVLENISQNIMDLLKPATGAATGATAKFAYNFATSLPSILIFIIALFIAAYFMSSDKERITKFLLKQLSPEWAARIVNIRNDLLFALLGYIKAQLILMSITFVEVSIGLLVIGVDYAILLALLISFIDALPILGTGTVLIPWGIISLAMGNYPMAFSLIILYGIVLLVRQLLEPKIVGVQIGLYPLVTLMSMYVGFQTFGIVGMILGPITVLIVRNLQRAGLFTLWKE